MGVFSQSQESREIERGHYNALIIMLSRTQPNSWRRRQLRTGSISSPGLIPCPLRWLNLAHHRDNIRRASLDRCAPIIFDPVAVLLQQFGQNKGSQNNSSFGWAFINLYQCLVIANYFNYNANDCGHSSALRYAEMETHSWGRWDSTQLWRTPSVGRQHRGIHCDAVLPELAYEHRLVV